MRAPRTPRPGRACTRSPAGTPRRTAGRSRGGGPIGRTGQGRRGGRSREAAPGGAGLPRGDPARRSDAAAVSAPRREPAPHRPRSQRSRVATACDSLKSGCSSIAATMPGGEDRGKPRPHTPWTGPSGICPTARIHPRLDLEPARRLGRVCFCGWRLVDAVGVRNDVRGRDPARDPDCLRDRSGRRRGEPLCGRATSHRCRIDRALRGMAGGPRSNRPRSGRCARAGPDPADVGGRQPCPRPRPDLLPAQPCARGRAATRARAARLVPRNPRPHHRSRDPARRGRDQGGPARPVAGVCPRPGGGVTLFAPIPSRQGQPRPTPRT